MILCRFGPSRLSPSLSAWQVRQVLLNTSWPSSDLALLPTASWPKASALSAIRVASGSVNWRKVMRRSHTKRSNFRKTNQEGVQHVPLARASAVAKKKPGSQGRAGRARVRLCAVNGAGSTDGTRTIIHNAARVGRFQAAEGRRRRGFKSRRAPVRDSEAQTLG